MLKKLKYNLGELFNKKDKVGEYRRKKDSTNSIPYYNPRNQDGTKDSISTNDNDNDSDSINKENTLSGSSNNDIKNDDIDNGVGKLNGDTINSNIYSANLGENVKDTKTISNNAQKDPHIYTFSKPKITKSISVTFILLEDNIELVESIDKIKSIISKMLSKYSDMLFLPIKYGKVTKEFGFINGSESYNTELLDNFLLLSNNESITLSNAMLLVTDYVKNINDKVKEFFKEKKDEKYQVKGINIIGIGTGRFYSDNVEKDMIIGELEELTNRYLVSSKYYCINDKQSVNAAALGFNLIGHINNNFYN